jgi:transcriptional regulator with XRE-family HTH domain
MKTNGEIRRDNLLIAIRRKKTAAQLAADAGISAAYLSQIKKRAPESSTGKAKKLGDDVAAKIEQALGEPPGWMDVSHPEQYVGDEEDSQVEMGLVSVPAAEPNEERGPDADEIIELLVSFTSALPKDRAMIMSSSKAAAKRASLLRRKASGQ